MRPQTIVERLDFVAKRIPGLKFTPPTQLKPGDDQCYGCFMSCDMYYIEIKVDQSHQSVKDVIISHGNSAEGISCPVLRKVLAEQDFETFAKHLSGLHSIYQINTNDKKVKQRAYPALTALETDLIILYDHQRRRTSDCHYLVHKSPIGIMEQRRGGLPVRLTYFVTPYDLIDTSFKSQINLTIPNIIEKSLGLSATVEIEGSSPHKIQVKSLISNQINSSLPIYAPFNSQNSEKLPAQFVLNLSQPFPMLNSSINQIVNEINTEPATIKDYLLSLTSSSKESLINLIARQELDLNKGPFNRSVDLYKQSDAVGDGLCDLKRHVYSIKLQEQIHTYHILDNHLEKPEGVYVTKIPFTHPTSIPSILKVLRQQALFNFVIGSCIRRSGKSSTNNNSITNNNNNINSTIPNHISTSTASMASNNIHNGMIFDETNNNSIFSSETNIFDVVPVNLNNICISFEHPSKESLATLEIDLRTISEPSCLLHALEKESVCSNEFATKVLQKCWSIPITLRSVLRKCNERRLALLEDANVRREREIQELIATNSQQTLQYKSSYQYQDEQNMSAQAMQPANLTINNSTHDIKSQDLKSKTQSGIKLGLNNNFGANTSDASNQTIINLTTDDESASRSNLLKKFSCKPKAKQTFSQNKNQTGNKTILSLMLKRQNPTQNSTEDANIKATTTKKLKKVASSTGQVVSKIPIANAPNATKVISLDSNMATKLANKQGIKLSGSQNVSLSLIRSPNKSGTINNQIVNSSVNTVQPVGLNLSSSNMGPSKSIDLNNINLGANNLTNSRLPKLQTNNINSNIVPNIGINNGKGRKGSIGAVLDRLVTGLNPEQQQQQQQLSGLLQFNPASGTNDDSKNSLKSKTKPSDQFAIKQGSSGGLKLTVTKTKPASASTSTNPTNSTTQTTTSSPMNATPTINPATTVQNSSTNANPSTSTTNETKSSLIKPDTNPLLNLGSTPPIKYTIPKISKTQSTTNQTNSSIESAANSNDKTQSQTKSDDTTNAPTSSTGNNNNNNSQATSISSTGTSNVKRSIPFSRANNINNNRNNTTVSSSTHPTGRTTSNPLANPNTNRQTPSNSIASNQNQQNRNKQPQLTNNINNRPMNNLQQQLQSSNIQRILNSNPVQPLLQQTPMFPIGLNPQILPSQNTTDINRLAMNQVAMLLQQQQLQQQPIQHQTLQQPLQPLQQQLQLQQQQIQQIQQIQQQTQLQQQIQPNQLQQSQTHLQLQQQPHIHQQPQQHSERILPTTQIPNPISDPSSPTEPSQVEAIEPPPLIPIDSIHDPVQASSPEADQPDDCSDRLSIIDTNEQMDCTSPAIVTSPRPSLAIEPVGNQQSNTDQNFTETIEASTMNTNDTDNNEVQASSTDADQPDDCGDRLINGETIEQISCTPVESTSSPKPSTTVQPSVNSLADQQPSSTPGTKNEEVEMTTQPSTDTTSGIVE